MVALVAGRLDATGGLEAVVVVVVVVVVVLVVGHANMEVTALLGMKCCMSSFLDLLFFWNLLGLDLLLFVGNCSITKVSLV